MPRDRERQSEREVLLKTNFFFISGFSKWWSLNARAYWGLSPGLQASRGIRIHELKKTQTYTYTLTHTHSKHDVDL